ncbi:hypothetical protein ACJ41O_010051 [Fusarium nematophilum]
MDSEAWYAIFRFSEEIALLQHDAGIEVLTSTPHEKELRLASYGLPPACRHLSNVIVRNMQAALENWAAGRGRLVKDLDRPHFRPEAFRLEPGCALWPARDYTAILMSLSNGRASVDLIPRSHNDTIAIEWDPGMVIHLHEMGIQLRGNGSVRFIYILFRTAPAYDGYSVW